MENQTIDKISVEESLINYIYDQIFDKKLHPGAKVSESVYAKEFDVSRDIVRKAFSQLQSIGILTHKKNQGFFLRWLSEQETRDLFLARISIEIGIVGIVTQKYALGEVSLDFLEDEVKAEEFYKVSLRNGEYVRTSCNFHLNLALLSGNDFLVDMLKPLVTLSILAGLVYDDSTSSFCSYNEHEELLNAIKSKDIELAKSFMNYHLHNCVKAFNFDID